MGASRDIRTHLGTCSMAVLKAIGPVMKQQEIFIVRTWILVKYLNP